MIIIENVLSEQQKQIKQALEKNGFQEVYAHILALRGVKSVEEARYGYPPVPTNSLKGIDVFAQKLADIIQANKKICIVADYDCDGATSCAIALEGLKILKAQNVNFFVPNRFKHGYGISQPVVEDLIKEFGKPDVIITVDNGIAAHSGVEFTKSLGIDILITDHHLPVKNTPNPIADALVNPNQVGDNSGLNNMAGCGVIFYCLVETAKELVKRNFLTEEEKREINSLLDLVSLGTIADVVKLDKNNRLLVKLGLKRLWQNKTRQGIRSLFSISGKNVLNANSQDYGFSIAPRINASGRLQDMTIGIRCLIEPTKAKADVLAFQLDRLNHNRKSLEKEMKDIAYEELNIDEFSVTKVIFHEINHEGVVGIVASRIKEETNCPSIVFSPTEEEAFIKGSGRSIPQVNLKDALDEVYKTDPSIFVGFGGHAMAAGLTIYKDRLNDFKNIFEDVVKNIVGERPLEKTIYFDKVIKLEDISLSLAKELESEIWGQGFLAPVFVANVELVKIDYINNKETGLPEHSKFIFKDIEGDSELEGIRFFHVEEGFKVGDQVKIVFTLSISNFRGEESVNLMLINILEQEK